MMCLLAAVKTLRAVLSRLNEAPRSVLLSMPGVGPKRADRILALSRRNERNKGTLFLKEALTAKALSPSLLARLTGDDNIPVLIKYAQLYRQCFHDNCQNLGAVLSLDLGLENAAFVLLDSDYTVLHWERLSLGMTSPYNPSQCFNTVMESLEQFPPADLYVMEEQSHRNPSNRGFLNISVQLRTLEAMVLAILKLTRSSSRVHTLSPSRVSRYFSTNGATGTAMKKRMSVKLVTTMMDVNHPLKTPLGYTLNVPTHLVEYFNTEKKQDDLSDCLLQAAAVLDWSKMAQELRL